MREDSLLQQYGLDIFEFARVEQKAWVVKSNQIAYFQPARVMEEVLVESQAFAHGDKDLWVEMRMYNHDRSRIKALMWSHFVFFNLKTNLPEPHTPSMLKLYDLVLKPIETNSFNERIANSRTLV